MHIILLLLSVVYSLVTPNQSLLVTTGGRHNDHNILLVDSSGFIHRLLRKRDTFKLGLFKLRGLMADGDEVYVGSTTLNERGGLIFVLSPPYYRSVPRIFVEGGNHLDHPYSLAMVSDTNESDHSDIHTPSSDDTRGFIPNPTPHSSKLLYVSDQTSSSIHRFQVPSGLPAPPSPACSSVVDKGFFFAAPFCPGHEKIRSVRGLALFPDRKRLALADVNGNSIHVFEIESGTLLYSLNVLNPIQIQFLPTEQFPQPFRIEKEPFMALITSIGQSLIVSSLEKGSKAQEWTVQGTEWRATSGIALLTAETETSPEQTHTTTHNNSSSRTITGVIIADRKNKHLFALSLPGGSIEQLIPQQFRRQLEFVLPLNQGLFGQLVATGLCKVASGLNGERMVWSCVAWYVTLALILQLLVLAFLGICGFVVSRKGEQKLLEETQKDVYGGL